MVLACREDSKSIRYLVHGSTHRSRTAAPLLTFRDTNGHISVHIHNVVAKKRDASTELLQRLDGYMKHHNVDFIGGDFNMSAFSTVGDVFSDPEFSATGDSFLWRLGAMEAHRMLEGCRRL